MAKAKAKTKAKPAPKKAAKPAKEKPAKKPAKKPATSKGPAGPVLRSIRSVIYQVDDLERARAFYAAALGREPYFDEPFYIGFDVDGQELGLHPDVSKIRPGPGGAVSYWRVDDIAASWDHLLALGGSTVDPPQDVGGGITTGIIADPCGNLVGLIQSA
jgi:predicted enzyme related to lactoylglutathione lyase